MPEEGVTLTAHLLKSLDTLVDGSGQANQGLYVTISGQTPSSISSKRAGRGRRRWNTYFPRVKPMNLFLLVSRKCSMSFSLQVHKQAVRRLPSFLFFFKKTNTCLHNPACKTRHMRAPTPAKRARERSAPH